MFLNSLEIYLSQIASKPQNYTGVGQGKAWLIPAKNLVINAIPLTFELREWTESQTLAYTLQENKKGYKVIHLWEDVWESQKEVVKGRLLSVIGETKRIHGRKTKVQRIVLPELRKFLKEHHSHIPTKAKYKYGLWQQEELVGVASFGAMVTIEREGKLYKSSELIRFCTKTGYTVVGGLSKLIKAFIKDRSPEHLMTYADRDWSRGDSYERIGFEKIGETPPQQFWVNPQNYERHYLNRMKEEAPKSWLPVYNTGNLKYIYWVG